MRHRGYVRTGCGLFAGLGVLAACATSPTGRRQLMLVEDEQMSQLGEQSFAQLKQELPAADDPQANAYVECVARNIIRELDKQYQLHAGKSWDVQVFEQAQANAFALPGGNIGVFTGMLEIAENQAQLAAVMAHEVGHVIADHGAERVSQTMVTQGGLAAAGAMLSDTQYRPAILGALGLGAQVGVLLPYGRAQESEADEIGLELMAKAGFDPREAVQLWKNMQEKSEGAPPEFLSTHPSHGSRIEHLQENMETSLALRQAAVAERGRPRCQALQPHASLRDSRASD